MENVERKKHNNKRHSTRIKRGEKKRQKSINTFPMAEQAIRPGFCVEVEGFIPYGCKRFSINLGKDGRNLVIHFDVRFDFLGDKGKIVLNSMKNGAWENEQKKGFFPFQEGSDTKVSFTFEQDTISVRLPTGSPLSFPIRFPITDITFVSVEEFKSKSITLE